MFLKDYHTKTNWKLLLEIGRFFRELPSITDLHREKYNKLRLNSPRLNSGEFPKTMQKLRLSTKFAQQENT